MLRDTFGQGKDQQRYKSSSNIDYFLIEVMNYMGFGGFDKIDSYYSFFITIEN